MCVDLHVVEHVNRLGEHLAVKVSTRPVSSDEIASAIHNAGIQFCVFEDDGAEETYRNFAERLMSWEQVGAVEIAKDPIEVFLYFVSMPASSSA